MIQQRLEKFMMIPLKKMEILVVVHLEIWIVVDKEELQSGKKLVLRKRKYVKGETLAENEELLYQGTWNPNSVMTGRWSSPLHTLPTSSDPKRYMTSRYKGGCVSMPDFSQAELRTVAKAANDKVLMKAYEDGIDVHMVTALGVYRRPASEITEIQRRYTKMCTFRILYGGTAQSIADEFFYGDLQSANEIFNGFFDTYFGVRDWMKEGHAEIKEKGVVTTMSNRAIRLGFEAPGVDIGKIMRQAGNAPDIEALM